MLKRNGILLIGGNTGFQFADVLFAFAMNIWIVGVTGDSKVLGLIVGISLIPMIIMNLLSGVIADNFNQKKLLVSFDLLSGVTCLILYTFSQEDIINIPFLIIINVLINISYACYSTVERSIVPNIIEKDKVQKVNSLMTVINESIKTSVPLVGGILVAVNFIGIRELFLIIAFSFFISAILQSFIAYSREKTEKIHIIKDFMAGFKYVKNQSVLLKLLILVSVFNFFVEGFNILLPTLALNNFSFENVNPYSIFLSAEAIGGIVSGLIIGLAKSDEIIKLKSLKNNLLLCGLSLLLIFTYESIFVYLIAVFFFGFFITRFNVKFFSYIQINTSEKELGKVFSFIFTMALILMPVGSLVFGAFSASYLMLSVLLIAIGIILSSLILS